jgi:TorA maturation chaperone TorD
MTGATASTIAFFPSGSPEDRARADMYALLSCLFYAAPDEALLRALAGSAEMTSEAEDVALALAWHDLIAEAALADADAVREEYDGLFIGTGKADITLYGAAYLKGPRADKPLVALREDLAALGLARRETVGEPEDHFSALCDVMRLLIAGDGEPAAAGLDEQRDFFYAHLEPWFRQLADTIEASGRANFYRPAGRFMRAFLELETQSFEIE